MKCTKCAHTWPIEQNTYIPSCPKCQGDAQPETLSEGLWLIYKNQGVEALKNEQKLMGLFPDLAPNLKAERNMLNLFLQAHGPSKLQAEPGEGGIHKVVRLLSENYGMNEQKAEYLCRAYLAALNGMVYEEASSDPDDSGVNGGKQLSEEDMKKLMEMFGGKGPIANDPLPPQPEPPVQDPPVAGYTKQIKVRPSGYVLWQELVMIYLGICLGGATIACGVFGHPLIAPVAAVIYYFCMFRPLGNAFKKSTQKKLQAQKQGKV